MVIVAVVCAGVFGVGIPLGWVWLASQVQPTIGQGTSHVAALIVVVGPLASYFALVAVAGRFNRPRASRAMAWNRSRDEVRESARRATMFEQVVLLSVFVGLLHERVYARCTEMYERGLRDPRRTPTLRETGEMLAAQAGRDDELCELAATFWRSNRARGAMLIEAEMPHLAKRAKASRRR